MADRHVLFMVTDFAPLPSIGRLRTQKFCRYLRQFGWRTSVLTLRPPPGTLTDQALLQEIPSDTRVHRVACPQPFDAPIRWASRLLGSRGNGTRQDGGTTGSSNAVGGSNGPSLRDRLTGPVDAAKKFLTRHLMVPDDTAAAFFGLAGRAVRIIEREQVDVLVASVPGFTPWLAAVRAGRRTGLPVVVDYRDLWHGDVLRHWMGPVRQRIELSLERRALAGSAAVVTVSQSKTLHVRGLDPQARSKPFETIYNGFDELDLEGVEPKRLAEDDGRLVLVHAGKLYGARRIDPLLESLGRLIRAGTLEPGRIRLRLLGTVDSPQRQRLDEIVQRYGLGKLLAYDGYVTRRHALARQLGADALVLVVDPGETSAGVIPGKLTEYIGLGRYVLALGEPGESHDLLKRYGHASWASACDPKQLDAALATLWDRWRADASFGRCSGDRSVVPTRRETARQLAAVLEAVLERRPAAATTGIVPDGPLEAMTRQGAWNLP
ncbi:MAG: glycosyltransferase [Phycisphaerae bacterium]